MTVDVEALKELLAWAEQATDWDQRYYARKGPECKTAFCLAGKTCLMIGEDSFDWETDDEVSHFSLLLRDGRTIWNVAIEALGLTQGQADCLFSGRNTIWDVRRIIEEIIASA